MASLLTQPKLMEQRTAALLNRPIARLRPWIDS
jgi:hypothetical protein